MDAHGCSERSLVFPGLGFHPLTRGLGGHAGDATVNADLCEGDSTDGASNDEDSVPQTAATMMKTT